MSFDLSKLDSDVLQELESLSDEEKKVFLKVLDEFSNEGSSNTLIDLYKDDFEEIPVTIEEFLHNPEYLGKGLIGDDGKFTVYPYWIEVLKKVFPNNIQTAYRTLVLSGAIGLGKSFVAVLCILYQLYRMMCLKNPYTFYGLQPIDKITFSFMNITLDASKGVAWDKAQSLLQSSPWFMARGTVSGRENIVWSPPKGIELIAGSQPRHVIGRAVFSNFCLDGDTKILTTTGIHKIKDLVDSEIQVYNFVNNNLCISDSCTVKPTVCTNEEIEIELEDGSVIKCTPEHKFLLKSGKYTEARLLTTEDEIKKYVFNNSSYNTKEGTKITLIKHNHLSSSKQYYDVIGASPYNNFLIKTNDSYIVSHNCDEISFILNQDVAKQVEKAKLLISTIDARMQSRFMKGEFNPTLNILASSKTTDQSFLETYIENKKKNESKTTLVVDEPQWVIRTDKDSPKKFWVAVGNKFLDSELVPLDATDDDLKSYTDRGYTLLAVPSGYYEQFVDDINVALTDIAGISTSRTSRYISGVRIKAVKHPEFKNPFIKDILEIGNAPDDKEQYQDYFDLSQVPEALIRKPLYIHLDMSISGDKTGIAGTWIIGKKPTVEGEEPSKDLFYRLAFSVSIKAPKGYQISFEKNRNFIRWLKNSGFNIRGISYDTFNSADLGQVLSAEGFNCSIISVDRVKDGICLPYQTLKNTIYEERVQMYDDCTLLTEELIGLERFSNGKLDHTTAGINCFTGDMKVRLVDGRSLTFLELVDEYNNGKTNYVYSINLETHHIEPKPILKAWCSGKNAKLLEITLDNDEIIKCTPNHKFMLRNGEYCFAKDLMIEDSLMPLYTKIDKDKFFELFGFYYEDLPKEKKDPWTNRYRNKLYDTKNHSVKNIRYLDYVEDVYDIEVEDNHNFALDAGVFVHNSKDQSDAFCLYPDTEIFLLSGKHKTIKELYQNYENEWVLGYNTNTSKLEPVKIQDVVNNGFKDNLIKLTLDTGKELICTEDHKILCRNGEYLEAKDCLNQSLMPFTYENRTMFGNRDYTYVYNPNKDLTNTGIYLHKLVAENVYSDIKELKTNTKEDNEWIVIHHKNCDRKNNSPNNLEYLTNTEHCKKHTEMNSSEVKRQQIREANYRLAAQGKHPFQLIDREILRNNGRKNLTALNKTEAHRKAVSDSNKRLAAEGKLSFQVHKDASQTPSAKLKRKITWNKKYNGIGFKSDTIQKKCRESCLANNGYDNPWHSKDKQQEMMNTRIINAWSKICDYLSIAATDTISLLDFKCACYALNIQITSDVNKLSILGINVDDSNFDLKFYEKLRAKGNCVKIYLKDVNIDKFTYQEFSDYYDNKINSDTKFRYRFPEKPGYEDIVKLGFNIYNHRVVKIEHVPGNEVYDIKLDKIHNFALTNGLFVHNCGSLYNASLHAEEYAFDFGEDLDTLASVNTNTSVGFEEMNQLSNQLFDKSTGSSIDGAKVIKDIDDILNLDSDILVW